VRRNGEILMLTIRAAAVSDVPLLLRFFRELAEYERQPGAVVITEEMLIKLAAQGLIELDCRLIPTQNFQANAI
jgi:hypothetical protein